MVLSERVLDVSTSNPDEGVIPTTKAVDDKWEIYSLITFIHFILDFIHHW